VVVDEDLLDRLEQLELEPFVGRVFRVTFGSTPPEKANTRGARWNPPDVAAIYTSLDRETVIAESEQILASQPIRPQAVRKIHSISVSLRKVLDLRSRELLASFGVDDEALHSSDFWACRRVGEAAIHLGCDGILVPSARSTGSNLVVYPANDEGSEFDVITEAFEPTPE
jgi:RES domain-containing protein